MQVGRDFIYDLSLLEITEQDISVIRNGNEDWVEKNKKYQELLSKKRKELQLKYHPDVCKDKDVGEEKSKLINAVYDCLKQVVLQPRQQMQPLNIQMLNSMFASMFRGSGSISSTTDIPNGFFFGGMWIPR